jgi:hypothetical protein
MRLIAVVVLLVVALTGCGQGVEPGCVDTRGDILVEYGVPDAVDLYEDEGYRSEVWYYTEAGKVFEFESGPVVCNCCTFTEGGT